jgi:hypothetical protein
MEYGTVCYSAESLLNVFILFFLFISKLPEPFSLLQKEEIRRLEQRIQDADVQNAMLKQRLARSDQQRLEGQQKIQHLRHEFMDVQARMPQRRTAGTPLTARRSGTNNSVNAGVFSISDSAADNESGYSRFDKHTLYTSPPFLVGRYQMCLIQRQIPSKWF